MIEADERERDGGRRHLLNYGHTIGHAIESVAGYGLWLHGEAVAAGMMAEAALGLRLGITSPEVVTRQSGLARPVRSAHALWTVSPLLPCSSPVSGTRKCAEGERAGCCRRNWVRRRWLATWPKPTSGRRSWRLAPASKYTLSERRARRPSGKGRLTPMSSIESVGATRGCISWFFTAPI